MKYINLQSASKSISVVAAIIAIGGVLTFTKNDNNSNKAIALNIIIGSSAIAIGNQFLTRHYELTANDQITAVIKDKDSQISAGKKEFQTLTEKHQKQVTALREAEELTKNQANQLTAKDAAINILRGQVESAKLDLFNKTFEIDRKLEQDDLRFVQLISAFKGHLVEDLSERIYCVYNILKNSCDAKLTIESYEKIYPQLRQFSDSLNGCYEEHCQELSQISQLDDSWDVITKKAVDIYSKVSDEIAALKVKYRNLLNIDERLNLEQAYMALSESLPKTKAVDKLREFSSASKSDLENLSHKVTENQNSLNEMRSQVSDLLDEIDIKNLEISKLQQQIDKLNQPLSWSAVDSRELKIGNRIIAYFWQSRIYLDRAYAEGDIFDVDICFQIDRNPRFIKESELNEHSEALQQWCRVLKPVVFKWDAGKALMVAKVVLKEREKIPTNIEEIRRLIESASRFGDVVRKYHDHTQDGKPTLRVMTRTGGGKGVAVKNILKNYVDSLENYEIWLSDPQHGSAQDFWNVPKAAKSPTEACSLLSQFVSEFNARKNSKSSHPNIPVIGVFDETDKTFDKKQKQEIAQIWTEIRHRDMRLILIGQSGEVGKNGWTWDEMNNCALLFIGEAIATAIKHADDLGWSSDMKDNIPAVYRTVSDWMNQANKSIPAKNKYRLGLILNGLRYEFLEIPPAIDGTFENGKSQLVNEPWESVNHSVEPQPTSVEQKINVQCPHCSSLSYISSGLRWKCKNQECKKTWLK